MNRKTCPYLGVLGPEQNQEAARNYPSFENCCFSESTPNYGSLLLGDQATYCVSGGYHQCPRFQTVLLQAGSSSIKDSHFLSMVEVATTSMPLTSDLLKNPSGQVDEEEGEDDFEEENDQRSIWLLSGSAFATVFLLGIVFAGYLGWQFVAESSLASPGFSQTLPNGDTVILVTDEAASQSLYVVVTATTEPSISQPLASQDVAEESQGVNVGEFAVVSQLPDAATPTIPPAQLITNQGQSAQSQTGEQQFPIAVTPTTVLVALNGQANQAVSADPANAQVVQASDVSAAGESNVIENNPQAVPATPTVTPVPEINVQVIVPAAPTRRVAPEVPLIPETVPQETPTETPTPTATWPPPLVFFGPAESLLREGKCTMVTWDVQNVRAVYYKNIGVDGKGEREECITDNDKTLLLTVVLPNGSTQNYTTTLNFEEPTVTPTPTWTFTPLPNPSPTWTPVPPTATFTPVPTKVVLRGVKLESAQPQNSVPHSCSPGVLCELGLLATNTGDDIDSIAIVLEERSQPNWSVILCRQDGVCSAERLVLTNVGAANTAFITLRVEAPGDAAGQQLAVRLYATSQESGDSVRSEPLSLQITIQ